MTGNSVHQSPFSSARAQAAQARTHTAACGAHRGVCPQRGVPAEATHQCTRPPSLTLSSTMRMMNASSPPGPHVTQSQASHPWFAHFPTVDDVAAVGTWQQESGCSQHLQCPLTHKLAHAQARCTTSMSLSYFHSLWSHLGTPSQLQCPRMQWLGWCRLPVQHMSTPFRATYCIFNSSLQIPAMYSVAWLSFRCCVMH